ncbi:MAG: tryptophan--tRNA ligase [Candidatus Aquicultor secundus]|uniref:Tryptophan--tRNA ligase n=1 Tax=Candidatus Aquicultor secundus TaxID=1973895 RepID=A0A2M7T722_9ACTN|nr:tryptophan--tRNA ligase [Candidatus Aquicultor secundus]NCO65692.1 tryptophan--tRNA ligase [Solirubrobacter sp.]OIO85551.1 MAG: tryptophan--tRNA ligase [Candidatus Aquicultor secundus]PIU27276.1 MAG: tryptophan--tRNA ligase [Candidatus Aquicultor secundus]PIW21465.1 MAG: tryptophan--tRNA ligase [Candidatus Aquicultor secundus]PIX52521.1 MAG: tryptophan--tRNA ligase [Candidatus Aquicultor secundus]
MRQRYFSGIQPTGELHIGNYLGAIKSWIELQDSFEGIFGIVDYHAITEPYKPEDMPKRVFDTALDYLAAGLDPNKSILLIQSFVPEHTEMAWLLSSVTPVSWVERVPTYKEKARQLKTQVNMGLLSYPVLMAADIVLYKSTIVPVGEDQLPHLELTREIVRSFNSKYRSKYGYKYGSKSGDIFPEPQAYLAGGSRIMSLTEPMKKMSKSLGAHNYIALADPPDVIRKKLAKAVTDIGPGGGEMSPGTKNLFQLMSLFSSKETCDHFKQLYDEGNIRYSDMKQKLADDIISDLGPIRDRRLALSLRPEYIRKVLIEGSNRAREIARQTLHEAKERMGLTYF